MRFIVDELVIIQSWKQLKCSDIATKMLPDVEQDIGAWEPQEPRECPCYLHFFYNGRQTIGEYVDGVPNSEGVSRDVTIWTERLGYRMEVVPRKSS